MKIDFEVRDYECDTQGIVNNANYLHYLEHARHKYLLEKNINFIELAKKDQNLVIKEAKYNYHQALKPDDKFYVLTEAKLLNKVKIQFQQSIYRQDELILTAELIAVCVSYENKKIHKINEVVSYDFQ